MKKYILAITTFLLLVPTSYADMGVNIGMGVPFISQLGFNVNLGNKWSVNAGYNSMDLTSTTSSSGIDTNTSIKLTMPAVNVHYHPFSGSFYLGLGFGRETLEVHSENAASNVSATAEVTANVTITTIGWMWGKTNGGLWFGVDMSIISPSGGEVDIKANGVAVTDKEYEDAKEFGETFGESSYASLTFTRLGYLF